MKLPDVRKPGLVVKEKGKRYQTEESRIGLINERIEAEYGELLKKRTPWTPDQDDVLLNAYFRGLHVYGGLVSMTSATQRTPRAIDTRLWKLWAKDDGNGNPLQYTPGKKRERRDGRPFTREDVQVSGVAWGDIGQRQGANAYERLAGVLARPVDEVHRWLTGMIRGGTRGLLPATATDPVEESTKALRRVLARLLKIHNPMDIITEVIKLR